MGSRKWVFMGGLISLNVNVQASFTLNVHGDLVMDDGQELWTLDRPAAGSYVFYQGLTHGKNLVHIKEVHNNFAEKKTHASK